MATPENKFDIGKLQPQEEDLTELDALIEGLQTEEARRKEVTDEREAEEIVLQPRDDDQDDPELADDAADEDRVVDQPEEDQSNTPEDSQAGPDDAKADEPDEITGEHAELFIWDEETQGYIPRDEEAARTIAILGDDLDVQIRNRETEQFVPMEYSFLERKMRERAANLLDRRAPETNEQAAPNAAADKPDNKKKEPPGPNLPEGKSASAKIVNSGCFAATRSLDTLWAGISTTVRNIGTLGVDGAKAGVELGTGAASALYQAAKKFLNGWKEANESTPSLERSPYDLMGMSPDHSTTLNDEGEVPMTEKPVGQVAEKVEQMKAANAAWVAEHVRQLDEKLTANLDAMAQTLDLENADTRIVTQGDMNDYVDSLPAERKKKVDEIKEEINRTIRQAAREAEVWIEGDGPQSFGALYEQDPELGHTAEVDLAKHYEEIEAKAKNRYSEFWNLLKLNSSSDEGIGTTFKSMFQSVGSTFKSILGRLGLRAEAQHDAQDQNQAASTTAPSAG